MLPSLEAAPDGTEPGRRPLLDSPVAWAVLLAAYVALGIVVKSAVLNWIVGPLFPLLFLYLLPRALRRRPPG